MEKIILKTAEDFNNARKENKKVLIECRAFDDPNFEPNGFYVKFVEGIPCAFNESGMLVSYNADLSANSEYTHYYVEE